MVHSSSAVDNPNRLALAVDVESIDERHHLPLSKQGTDTQLVKHGAKLINGNCTQTLFIEQLERLRIVHPSALIFSTALPEYVGIGGASSSLALVPIELDLSIFVDHLD